MIGHRIDSGENEAGEIHFGINCRLITDLIESTPERILFPDKYRTK